MVHLPSQLPLNRSDKKQVEPLTRAALNRSDKRQVEPLTTAALNRSDKKQVEPLNRAALNRSDKKQLEPLTRVHEVNSPDQGHGVWRRSGGGCGRRLVAHAAHVVVVVVGQRAVVVDNVVGKAAVVRGGRGRVLCLCGSNRVGIAICGVGVARRVGRAHSGTETTNIKTLLP